MTSILRAYLLPRPLKDFKYTEKKTDSNQWYGKFIYLGVPGRRNSLQVSVVYAGQKKNIAFSENGTTKRVATTNYSNMGIYNTGY